MCAPQPQYSSSKRTPGVLTPGVLTPGVLTPGGVVVVETVGGCGDGGYGQSQGQVQVQGKYKGLGFMVYGLGEI